MGFGLADTIGAYAAYNFPQPEGRAGESVEKSLLLSKVTVRLYSLAWKLRPWPAFKWMPLYSS